METSPSGSQTSGPPRTSFIALAGSDSEIGNCFAVLSQLRPHLGQVDFLARVRRQQQGGYQLAFLSEAGNVRAVGGFRMFETLAWGRMLYVDDLVTDAAHRSCGHGEALFDWLVAYARAADCGEFHLDSGVQRFGAHRFYLARRMDLTCHHFALQLQ